jgi:enoyl-CoA hydratase
MEPPHTVAANEHGTLTEADGVITVTMNRPEKLNAISPQMTKLYWDALTRLGERDDLHAMVIRAHGRYFSAGIDISRGPTGPDDVDLPSEPGARWRWAYRRHHLLYDGFEAVEKPIILAAQGPCLGAALEMACSCDVRLSTPDALFGLPEIRLGVIPASGGVSRLTRLAGPHWARWIAMLGQDVDAETARQIGLIHAIYPAEGFHDRVHEFAASLANIPSEAMGVTKLTIEACVDAGRDTARYVERIVNTPFVFSDDTRRRKARFQRRE